MPPAGPKLSPSVATPPNTASRGTLVYMQQGVDRGARVPLARATIDRYAGRAQLGVDEESCEECTRRNRKLVRGKPALASIVRVGAARTAAVHHSR